jgi:LacI family transcriptional regulator
MGQRAAELLLKQIKAGKAEPEAIVGSVRLVVRQSCGAAVERKREALA